MTKILRSTFFADGKPDPKPDPKPDQTATPTAVNWSKVPPPSSGNGSSSGSASKPPVQSPAPVMDANSASAMTQPSGEPLRQPKLESTFLQGSSQPESQPDEQPAAEQPDTENSGSWSLFGVTMKKLYWILSGVGLVVLLAVVTKYLSR